ncbi:hypothetical protein AYM17_07810 [Coxiella burnetii]|nr:hypothetical protein [Coxiella burnetii]ACJ18887.1 hypothetical protein CbuG_1595 [Coxiella burnetii CbuG_Q212]ATN67248.1 hypothetical protein AYM17_07810 [Coxiella burnetii]OYK85849.1 hypothetical protein CbuQ229_08100 [Coxiella burnetii]
MGEHEMQQNRKPSIDAISLPPAQPFNFRLIIPGCGTSSALLARSARSALGPRLRGDDGVF